MCKVISVANHKGGVAKTTSVVNIGIGIARKGQRVLLVDADPQGSLTSSLGFPEPDLIEYTLADGLDKILEGKDYDPMEGILHHEEGVDLIPGNIDLSVLGVNLIRAMRAEFVLKEYLESLKEKYDWILIDCMPSLEKLTVNALAAADSVIIPVQTGYLPTKGLAQIKKTIDKVIRRKVNAKLKIEGILLTMVEPFGSNIFVPFLPYIEFKTSKTAGDALLIPSKTTNLLGKLPSYSIA